jgi:hypothetical protein
VKMTRAPNRSANMPVTMRMREAGRAELCTRVENKQLIRGGVSQAEIFP